MARKFDYISTIYEQTAKKVTARPESWMRFLKSACNNFKLRFDEQLLIYAQRPDATAVLEIERWNEGFGRWVNKGAKGIAVFEDSSRSRQRLKHYFDISDTHESYHSRPVPIWKMRREYEQEVIETLENTFGYLEDKADLAAAVMSAVKNAVEDNVPDYIGDLLHTVDNSFLEELSEDMVAAMYRKLVRNSVAFMMMSRLSMDTSEYFEGIEFEDIVNFNTPDTLNALGFAASDIAEMGLAEISKTVLALSRQNRIIAEQADSGYNETDKYERSFENDRDKLHNAGGLSAPESDLDGAAGGNDGQIRRNAEEVSERTSSGTVLQSADEGRTDGAFERNGADSLGDGRSVDESNGKIGGLDGGAEIGGYDELGAEDEQSPQQSAGDSFEGNSLRLSRHERSDEDEVKPLPSLDGQMTLIEEKAEEKCSIS